MKPLPSRLTPQPSHLLASPDGIMLLASPPCLMPWPHPRYPPLPVLLFPAGPPDPDHLPPLPLVSPNEASPYPKEQGQSPVLSPHQPDTKSAVARRARFPPEVGHACHMPGDQPGAGRPQCGGQCITLSQGPWEEAVLSITEEITVAQPARTSSPRPYN